MILKISVKNVARSLVLLGFLFASQISFAYTQSELETFDNEPPIIKDLLERASVLVGDEKDADAPWKAADLYCQAARYGSAEGVYRLGMLYAFGRGVPQNSDYAANLFGIASVHGHFEAQKMLETIEITTDKTPLCIVEEVKPEKAPRVMVAAETPKQGAPAIDAYIANLPKNKRWVVDLVGTVSDWYKVDSKLVLSIITAESNFKVTAKSNADAHGLMQLIPATAERFNVKDAYNASQNVKGGVKYLRWLLSYFRGDVPMAVAAYNAGEGAVDKYKGVPPYKETKAYVAKVMGLYQNNRHDFDASLARESPALTPAVKAKMSKKNFSKKVRKK
jgi:soluble lytic murein transglycosylase-like protein